MKKRGPRGPYKTGVRCTFCEKKCNPELLTSGLCPACWTDTSPDFQKVLLNRKQILADMNMAGAYYSHKTGRLKVPIQTV